MTKIYVQNIRGKYRTIKNIISIFLLFFYFSGSWIIWNRGSNITDQAIMIDLAKRKGYFFSLEIWSDELYYLTAILILAAMALFIITSIFGRIWCGYTCPHTVFTDIFIKIETFFQGDRNNLIRLSQEGLSIKKVKIKFLTHLAWLLVSFLFAYGWVCYFYGSHQLTKDLLSSHLSKNGLIWLASLTGATYFFAGFVREKVCAYCCPYGRFQSAMFDNSTRTVTYDQQRGEPRSNKHKSLQEQVKKSGDCIDCGKCVIVCPMGIDIRNGLQMKCIDCGLCIDACNSVMTKIGKDLDLISYRSLKIANKTGEDHAISNKFNINTKVYGYSFFFIFVLSILVYLLLNKEQYSLTVVKEHDPLFIRTFDNNIRNVYKILITNKSKKNDEIIMTIEDDQNTLPFAIQASDGSLNFNERMKISIPRDEEIKMRVFVQAHNNKKKEQMKIRFNLKGMKENKDLLITDQSTFILP